MLTSCFPQDREGSAGVERQGLAGSLCTLHFLPVNTFLPAAGRETDETLWAPSE